jgi:Protein phosphatase 2C
MSDHPGALAGQRMRVVLATEPGAAERPNEDFAAAVPGAVVLLDGAGFAPDSATGCVHGVAWYARTLGALLAGGACDDRVPLPDLLSRGIEQVSRMHAGTCDLRHPATPSATVIVARQRGGTLEYLVLCDSVLLLLRRAGEPSAITDTQLEEARTRLRPAASLRAGTPGYDAAWRAYRQRLEAARNQPGGFWVAAANPGAASHALTGTEPLTALSAVALLSDGASRLADRFQLATWGEIGAILTGEGPADLIQRVRAAEAADPHGARWPRGKIHDDATAVLWRMAVGSQAATSGAPWRA